MTRCALERPRLVRGVGFVLCAHWVVRAEQIVPETALKVLREAPSRLDQPSERPFGVRRPRVDEDPVSAVSCVDALAQRA